MLFHIIIQIPHFRYSKARSLNKYINEPNGTVPNGLRRKPNAAAQPPPSANIQDFPTFRPIPGKMFKTPATKKEAYDRQHASEALAYITELYRLEEDMRQAGLSPDEIRERREKEAYPTIRRYEKWMNSVAPLFRPKSRMGKALVYNLSLIHI